jgi:hypothetical protein
MLNSKFVVSYSDCISYFFVFSWFFLGLCQHLDFIASNGRMVDALWIGEDLEGSSRGLTGTQENTEILNADEQYLDRDSNRSPLEYKSGVSPLKPACWAYFFLEIQNVLIIKIWMILQDYEQSCHTLNNWIHREYTDETWVHLTLCIKLRTVR